MTTARKSAWRCFHCQAYLEAVHPDPCDCGVPDSWFPAVPSSSSELRSEAPTRRARRAEDIPPDTTPRLATLTELDQVLAVGHSLGGGLAETSTVLLYGDPGKGKTRAALRMVAAYRSSLVVSLEQPAELTVDTARSAGADLRGMDVVEELDGWELEAEGKRAVLVDSVSVAPAPTRLLIALRQWATRTRGIVIVISQVNADGKPLGPKALQHWPDYVIQSTQGPACFTHLRIKKSRYCALGEIDVRIVRPES